MNVLNLSLRILALASLANPLPRSLVAAPLALEVSPSGALASLSAAQAELQRARQEGRLGAEGAVITVRGGRYEFNASLQLTAADSVSAAGPIRDSRAG
jgi:hypothetical protein